MWNNRWWRRFWFLSYFFPLKIPGLIRTGNRVPCFHRQNRLAKNPFVFDDHHRSSCVRVYLRIPITVALAYTIRLHHLNIRWFTLHAAGTPLMHFIVNRCCRALRGCARRILRLAVYDVVYSTRIRVLKCRQVCIFSYTDVLLSDYYCVCSNRNATKRVTHYKSINGNARVF